MIGCGLVAGSGTSPRSSGRLVSRSCKVSSRPRPSGSSDFRSQTRGRRRGRRAPLVPDGGGHGVGVQAPSQLVSRRRPPPEGAGAFGLSDRCAILRGLCLPLTERYELCLGRLYVKRKVMIAGSLSSISLSVPRAILGTPSIGGF